MADYDEFAGNQLWNERSLMCIRAMNAFIQDTPGCYRFNDFDWQRIDAVMEVAQKVIQKMQYYKQQQPQKEQS